MLGIRINYVVPVGTSSRIAALRVLSIAFWLRIVKLTSPVKVVENAGTSDDHGHKT